MNAYPMKRLAALLTAAALAAVMTACRSDRTREGGVITTADPSLFATVSETALVTDSADAAEEADSGPKALFDREGNIIQAPESVNRIISASPSVTEILAGLGAGEKIIAADMYSYDVEGISPEICSLDFYSIDIEELAALSPDLLIAGGRPDGDDPYAELKNEGVNVIYIPESNSISGIKLDIEFIAAYLGLESKGRALINEIDEAVRTVSDKAAPYNYAKSVYFETNPAPALCSCGSETLIDELITIAGGRNIYGTERGVLANSEESVIAANPDVIITNVVRGGYDFGEIKNRSGWENIEAVKNGAVYHIDANITVRPSQNIVKGIYQVAAAVYPELYSGEV